MRKVFYPAKWAYDEDIPFKLAQVDVKDIYDKGTRTGLEPSFSAFPLHNSLHRPSRAISLLPAIGYLSQNSGVEVVSMYKSDWDKNEANWREVTILGKACRTSLPSSWSSFSKSAILDFSPPASAER